MSSSTIKLPEHVNESCLKTALEESLKECVEIVELEVKLMGGDAENFCSKIYRLTVTIEIGEERRRKVLNFVVKDMIMEVADVGTNELEMYQKIIPELTKILSEGKLDDKMEMGDASSNRLAPSALYCERNDKYEFYILDDLNAEGFILGNRYDGLTESQCRIILAKLAKFHAASMIYAERHPDVISKLSPAHFAEGTNDPISTSITKGGLLYAADFIENLGDFKELAEKIRRLVENFDRKIPEIVRPEKCPINVLNHGDLWTNNILVKNEDSKEDIIMVDFQNVFYGSPGYDLHYFFQTSLPLSLLKDKLDDLTYFYYEILRSTLERCAGSTKLVIPTWEEMQRELQRSALVGVYAVACELPICCANPTVSEGFTVQTFTDPVAMSKKRVELYDNSRVKETLAYSLPIFEKLGVFD